MAYCTQRSFERFCETTTTCIKRTYVFPAWMLKWAITQPLRTFLYYDADSKGQTRNLKKKFQTRPGCLCFVRWRTKKIPIIVRSLQSINKSLFNTACLFKLTFYRKSLHIQRNELVQYFRKKIVNPNYAYQLGLVVTH